jgi:hypothetical protein
VPQNKGRLQRDQRPLVLGNKARCIVCIRASNGIKSLTCKARFSASQPYAGSDTFVQLTRCLPSGLIVLGDGFPKSL